MKKLNSISKGILTGLAAVVLEFGCSNKQR